MARRLGVMDPIWTRQIFRMYRANEGWTPYTGSSPHTDHVHVSLTRRGGNKRTSFWTMRLPGPTVRRRRPIPRPVPGGPGPSSSRPRAVDGMFEHAQVGDFDGNG